MSISRKKLSPSIINKRGSDPLDRIILEGGLRIHHVLLDPTLDLIVLVLTKGIIIKSKISEFPRLRDANPKQLNKWSLIGEGLAIEWKELNEDLSLKGFLKSSMNRALITLQGSKANELA